MVDGVNADEVRPAIEAEWPALADMLREHDGDEISAGLRYAEMGAVARFLGGQLAAGNTERFAGLFGAVERCLLEGDDEAVRLVVVGLIEDLQNRSLTGIEDTTLWLRYLSPTTARAWKAVEAFWAGDTEAISDFKPHA